MTDRPGSPGWLLARIAEHQLAHDQAAALANAHKGAMQAYQRLLRELAEQVSSDQTVPTE